MASVSGSFDGAHNEPCHAGRRQLEHVRLTIQIDLRASDAPVGAISLVGH
jgi:hypothetical protein